MYVGLAHSFRLIRSLAGSAIVRTALYSSLTVRAPPSSKVAQPPSVAQSLAKSGRRPFPLLSSLTRAQGTESNGPPYRQKRIWLLLTLRRRHWFARRPHRPPRSPRRRHAQDHYRHSFPLCARFLLAVMLSVYFAQPSSLTICSTANCRSCSLTWSS